MRTYITATIVIATLVLITFLVVEALEVPVLTDPSDYFEDAGIIGATVSVGLLLVDVFVPIPSSVVMIGNGAMFGVAGGALLTLAGAVGGAMVGFLVGRRGAGLIRRFVSQAEQRRADALIERWGLLAIVVTRPMPILAETVAVMAGTSAIGWRRMLVGSIVGVLPAAVIYAITGAFTTDLGSGLLVFGAVIVLAGTTWLVSRRLESRFARTAGTGTNTST